MAKYKSACASLRPGQLNRLMAGIKDKNPQKGEDMELTYEEERTMKLAESGYSSYCKYTNWKSIITGDDLPKWNALPGAVKNAWFAAASGIVAEIGNNKVF